MNQITFERRSETIYQDMVSASAKKVALACTSVMNVLQHFKTSEQFLAIASLLIMLNDNYGIRPIEALNVADNILEANKNNKDIVEFRALNQYFKDDFKL
jgi:hypothetical protein